MLSILDSCVYGGGNCRWELMGRCDENEKPECNLDVTKLTDKELSFLKAGLFELLHTDDDDDAHIISRLSQKAGRPRPSGRGGFNYMFLHLFIEISNKENDRRWEIRRN